MANGKILLKGSEIAVKALEELGVGVVFAYPGGQAIEIHQALVRSRLRVVLPRHERDWEEFRQARFLPEHFLEDVPFDRMEAEYIEPDKKKTVNPEYL